MSKAPRKIPGKPRELLTWLAKSPRPVATMRAPACCASQGQISGTGLAQAKTIASLAMAVIHSGRISLGSRRSERNANVRARESRLRSPPATVSALVSWQTRPFVREPRLICLQVLPSTMQGASSIAGNDVAQTGPSSCQQTKCGHVRGPHADHGNLDLVQRFANHCQRVHQSGNQDRCRALLIIMPDGDPSGSIAEHRGRESSPVAKCLPD